MPRKQSHKCLHGESDIFCGGLLISIIIVFMTCLFCSGFNESNINNCLYLIVNVLNIIKLKKLYFELLPIVIRLLVDIALLLTWQLSTMFNPQILKIC